MDDNTAYVLGLLVIAALIAFLVWIDSKSDGCTDSDVED